MKMTVIIPIVFLLVLYVCFSYSSCTCCGHHICEALYCEIGYNDVIWQFDNCFGLLPKLNLGKEVDHVMFLRLVISECRHKECRWFSSFSKTEIFTQKSTLWGV